MIQLRKDDADVKSHISLRRDIQKRIVRKRKVIVFFSDPHFRSGSSHGKFIQTYISRFS